MHGVSSGIGLTATQLAHEVGVTVYATVGNVAKVRACVGAGAHLAINYREDDFVSVIDRETAGRGVDAILDIVGASYAQRNIRCLASDGRLVLIAMLEGSQFDFDARGIMMKWLVVRVPPCVEFARRGLAPTRALLLPTGHLRHVPNSGSIRRSPADGK